MRGRRRERGGGEQIDRSPNRVGFRIRYAVDCTCLIVRNQHRSIHHHKHIHWPAVRRLPLKPTIRKGLARRYCAVCCKLHHTYSIPAQPSPSVTKVFKRLHSWVVYATTGAPKMWKKQAPMKTCEVARYQSSYSIDSR